MLINIIATIYTTTNDSQFPIILLAMYADFLFHFALGWWPHAQSYIAPYSIAHSMHIEYFRYIVAIYYLPCDSITSIVHKLSACM